MKTSNQFFTDLTSEDQDISSLLEISAWDAYQNPKIDAYWFYETQNGNQWATVLTARKGCKTLTEHHTLSKSEHESNWDLAPHQPKRKFKSLSHLLKSTGNRCYGGLLESSMAKEIESMTAEEGFSTVL